MTGSKTDITYFKNNIVAFTVLLSKVNIHEVSDNTYCRNYLAHLLNHKLYYLHVYSDVLHRITTGSEKAVNELTLLDFGAGNGLLGLFAKFCGFKKVFINEIDESFMRTAHRLSIELQIGIDGFVPGDINTVKEYLNTERIDAIAATDVIEHIYDLDDFFSILKTINPEIISVFTTGSNPKNPVKVFRIKKLQRKDEYFGSDPSDFLQYGNEPHEAFIFIRRNIIQEYLSGLSESESLFLAKRTRGMDKKHIIKSLEKYKLYGILPEKPKHSTNTCHPITGSWTERILSLGEYRKLYAENGFTLKTHYGFYDIYKKGLKGFVNRMLNIMIIIFGKHISPYIILYGKSTKKS